MPRLLLFFALHVAMVALLCTTSALALLTPSSPVTLSASCTTAFGPGLDPMVSTMIRHFTVQLCTTEGVNVTSSSLVDFVGGRPYGSGQVLAAKMTALDWRGGSVNNNIRIADRGDGTEKSSSERLID